MVARVAIAYVFAVIAVSDAAIPTRTLPGGVQLPMLYMGSGNFTTWLKLVGPGGGIKTAWEYGAHSQQGMLPQVRAAGLKREDVFLETMIPCGGVDGSVEPMTAAQAEKYIKQDLSLLGTDYIDLLLIHHRCATPAETQVVWKTLEAALKRGDARAIGVSNFDASDLAMLQAVATEPIAVNEGHFGVGIMDYDTIEFCNKHNIALVSFSSLAAAVPSNHPTLTSIAKKHNVSTVQIMYRFVSSYNISVLSSFHKLEHAVEDMAIFDIELDKQDIVDIQSLQTEKQTCTDCFTKECQACAQLLLQNGCPVGNMPAWGRDNPDSAKCMTCAAKHNATITETCGPHWKVSKACGTAGGFPSGAALDMMV